MSLILESPMEITHQDFLSRSFHYAQQKLRMMDGKVKTKQNNVVLFSMCQHVSVHSYLYWGFPEL